MELALGGGDASTLERLDGSGSVVAGEGNTFFSKTNITGVNVSNLTSVQGALDAWYVESDAYWYGPTSNVYYLTGEYANAVSNDAKAVGMAAVMLSNQEVYIVCVFGDAAPEETGDSTYAPTTGGAIYQGVNVRQDNLALQLVAPQTLTASQPAELGINASTTLSGNAVGKADGVAIDSTELLAQADVQVVQDGAVVGHVVDGVLQAEEGFASGAATLQVVMGDEVVASAAVEVVAVAESLEGGTFFDVAVPDGGAVERAYRRAACCGRRSRGRRVRGGGHRGGHRRRRERHGDRGPCDSCVRRGPRRSGGLGGGYARASRRRGRHLVER